MFGQSNLLSEVYATSYILILSIVQQFFDWGDWANDSPSQ